MKYLKHLIIYLLFPAIALAEPLCHQVVSKQVSKGLYKKETQNHVTLKSILQSGTDYQESKIGCYAGDKESYKIFSKLFDNVIKKYHKTTLPIKHPKNIDINDIDFSSIDNDYIYPIHLRLSTLFVQNYH